MAVFDIRPHDGSGPLRLGMSPSEVHAAVGERHFSAVVEPSSDRMETSGVPDSAPNIDVVRQLHTMWKGTDPAKFFEWIDSDVEREGSGCSVLAEFFVHIGEKHTVVEADYVRNAAQMQARLPAWRRQAGDEEG